MPYTLKVCKFGGTSMAGREAMLQSASIVKADKTRKFVVVSAPGKRYSNDMKVTDLLYSAYNEKLNQGRCSLAFEQIRTRFTEIVADLGIRLNIEKYLDDAQAGIDKSETPDFAASRGEYLSAIIMSEVLGFEFVDAKDIIRFDEKGNFDAEETNKLIGKRFPAGCKPAVIPGFYGAKADGTIKTFSRGGSDVSGAIVARGVRADLYENWTDVNGFMTTDPRIVKNPLSIDVLSYEELRELSYMGASVLHPESIFPVKFNSIPINIKNTFDPDHKGTMILANTDGYSRRIVTGIAGKKGNTTILIKKAMMNSEVGYVNRVLSVLAKEGVSFEHMPTGIDTMSLIINNDELKNGKEQKLIDAITKDCKPDFIDSVHDLALIAVVGHGMANQTGTAARVFLALASEKVNVRMIDQGSSEMNIIIGVEEKDCNQAISAIYNVFFG